MLPGSCGRGIAHLERDAVTEGAHSIGNQTVLTPIAAADHIAGPGCRDGRQAIAEAMSEGCGHHLSTGLADTVRFDPTKSVVFPEWPVFTRIFVDFVRGHDHDA